MKHLKANRIFCVISIVLPGGLVQGLRVTLMYICSLAKGTDSDNVRHSGPDIHLSHQKRSLTYLKIDRLSQRKLHWNLDTFCCKISRRKRQNLQKTKFANLTAQTQYRVDSPIPRTYAQKILPKLLKIRYFQCTVEQLTLEILIKKLYYLLAILLRNHTLRGRNRESTKMTAGHFIPRYWYIWQVEQHCI